MIRHQITDTPAQPPVLGMPCTFTNATPRRSQADIISTLCGALSRHHCSHSKWIVVQVEDPAASLPVGIMGAVGIAAALYVALSAVICAMVPYGEIQAGAPFSQAFLSLLSPGDGRLHSALLRTSARFVSFGAVTGAAQLPDFRFNQGD